MKKLAMAMMLGVAALSANAQVNYRMQTACNPQDVKNIRHTETAQQLHDGESAGSR